jgi:hypothetical protein
MLSVLRFGEKVEDINNFALDFERSTHSSFCWVIFERRRRNRHYDGVQSILKDRGWGHREEDPEPKIYEGFICPPTRTKDRRTRRNMGRYRYFWRFQTQGAHAGVGFMSFENSHKTAMFQEQVQFRFQPRSNIALSVRPFWWIQNGFSVSN